MFCIRNMSNYLATRKHGSIQNHMILQETAHSRPKAAKYHYFPFLLPLFLSLSTSAVYTSVLPLHWERGAFGCSQSLGHTSSPIIQLCAVTSRWRCMHGCYSRFVAIGSYSNDASHEMLAVRIVWTEVSHERQRSEVASRRFSHVRKCRL